MIEKQRKFKKLSEILSRYRSLLVAFSGGVDSTVLLKAAAMVLNQKMVAVTADSPALPRKELAAAQQIAREIGAKHIVIQTDELENENYRTNPANRCYFCKSELYSRLKEIASRENIDTIANGTNLDDLQDYRPGLQAADEFRVVSPLKEAGLTKVDVRELARLWKLPVWEKPASPCLASRIPYRSEVTRQKLGMIEAAEDFLKDLQIDELRVRHFGTTARIEAHGHDLRIIEQNLSLIKNKFRVIGFETITFSEFNSGSLNSVLDRNE